MTVEEIRARAIAAEKRAKHEYYMANRDRIREKQKEYAKRTRAARSATEKKCREAKPMQYAETQLKYWRKKAEDETNRQAQWNTRYWTKKIEKLKEEAK
jgi:uncharacterized protein YccT (UPF0319 family)